MTHKCVDGVYEVARGSGKSDTVEDGAFESSLDILRTRQRVVNRLCVWI